MPDPLFLQRKGGRGIFEVITPLDYYLANID